MSSTALSIITGYVGNVTIKENLASFGMAVRYFKDGPTHWLNCVVFRTELIKIVQLYVPKGRFIQVIGRPEVRVWQHNDETRSRDVHVIHQIILFPRETYSIGELPALSEDAPASDLGEPVFTDPDPDQPEAL